MIPPVTVLSHNVLTTDLRNCIATFPVTARHRGREIAVRFLSTVDMVMAMEGGTLDNMNMGVVAVRDDFNGILPKSMDDFDVLFQGKWKKFQVRDVPDYHDPRVHIVTINLQSPHKGIS
jgi:hypothetical protein